MDLRVGGGNKTNSNGVQHEGASKRMHASLPCLFTDRQRFRIRLGPDVNDNGYTVQLLCCVNIFLTLEFLPLEAVLTVSRRPCAKHCKRRLASPVHPDQREPV